MSVKAKVEAIIYATEEPVTLNELAALLKDPVLAELRAEEAARLALNETVSDGAAGAENSVDADDDLLLDEIEDDSGPVPESAEAATAPPDEPAPAATTKDQKQAEAKEELKAVKARLAAILDELIADYADNARGMEIRQIAGGYRMATKPEHHDVVVSFAKSLKPPVRLSLQSLETLAVIAYKQPVTVPEISEIRGVDSAGVIATLLDRKLITTAGRKQVIGRPILYKTTKEFLLRFGLNDVAELPSMEEFEKLGDPQADLFDTARPPDASGSSPEDEPVTEAVPEAGAHLMGETVVPADGARVSEAEPVLDDAAQSWAEDQAQEKNGSDEPEPVTEAVPEVTHHHLAGESTMPADGEFATEAETAELPEKP
jgi:segregation and condensation protein B